MESIYQEIHKYMLEKYRGEQLNSFQDWENLDMKNDLRNVDWQH